MTVTLSSNAFTSDTQYSPDLAGDAGGQFAVGGAVAVDGTAGSDTLVINATGPDSGTYVLNGGPAIDLVGVTSFTFNGGDGNDFVIINNPAGGLFGLRAAFSSTAERRPAPPAIT